MCSIEQLTVSQTVILVIINAIPLLMLAAIAYYQFKN